MALDFKWTDRVDGVDKNSADDINEVAHAVGETQTELKKAIESNEDVAKQYRGGCKGYTVLDMSFSPKTIELGNVLLTGYHCSAEAVEFDGKMAIKMTADRSSTGIPFVRMSSIAGTHIDFSVYKYFAANAFLAGATKPKNEHSKLAIRTGNGLTTQIAPWMGFLGSNAWVSLGAALAVEGNLDPTTQTHILKTFDLYPFRTATANLWAKDNVVYFSDITFYEKDPAVYPEQPTTFALDGVGGLEVGDTYTTNILTYEEFNENTPAQNRNTECAGQITAIDTTNNIVTVSRQPINIHTFASRDSYIKNGEDTELNVFRVHYKLDAGTRNLGANTIQLGDYTSAQLDGAISVGDGNYSIGNNSITFGKSCEAFYCSIAGGVNTKVWAHQAIGVGTGLRVRRSNQAAFGQWNIPDLESLLIIGNGTGESNRSNALRILADGTIEINKKDGTKLILQDVL